MSEPTTVFTVGPRDRGKRLDRFLQERIPGLSRARLQEAIRTRIELSWEVPARPATPVRPGGTVRIGWNPPEETPLDLPIPVLARGRGWLAIDKPAGIPVHPVNTVRENTIVRMLRRQERSPELRLVHRLDRETSGALVVAADRDAARPLSRAFLRGEVEKEYLAWVSGEVKGDRGEVDAPVARDESSRVYTRQGVVEGGKPARTLWRVESRKAGRTLLRVRIETGRRHQIRVHLAHIGHPVLGDILYGRPDDDYLALVRGDGDVRASAGGPLRQLLHCARLVFPDPASGRATEVVAPLPADMAAASSDMRS